jgi:3-oxoacyl-(acyl-carrier-protein) synthase
MVGEIDVLTDPAIQDELGRLGIRNVRSMSRESRLMVMAAAQAMRDSKRTSEGPLGVFVGTLYSGNQHFMAASNALLAGVAEGINPAHVSEAGYNAPASHVSIRLDGQGPNLTIAAGRSSALEAMRSAGIEIARGDCGVAIAGGVDIAAGRSRAIDAAACVALERLPATAPGCTILLKAVETDFVPDPVLTAEVTERIIRDVITAAGIQPNQIDAVFTADNSNKDAARALDRVLDDCVPVGASFMPETSGAAGALLVVAAALALERNMMPTSLSGRLLRNVLVITVDNEGYAGAAVVGKITP